MIRVSGLEPGGPFDATGVVEARDRIVTHNYQSAVRDGKPPYPLSLPHIDKAVAVRVELVEHLLQILHRVRDFGLDEAESVPFLVGN